MQAVHSCCQRSALEQRFTSSDRACRHLLNRSPQFDKFDQLKPGLSSYADNPPAAAESLAPLLELAEKTIPKDAQAQTSIMVRWGRVVVLGGCCGRRRDVRGGCGWSCSCATCYAVLTTPPAAGQVRTPACVARRLV